jgi:threonine/homoserine/homoserine lactone efflux protein
MDQGRRAGIVSTLGIAAGTLFHIAAAAFGVSAILMTSAVAFNVVKYLGAAYLIYLGVHKLIEKEAPQKEIIVTHQTLSQIFYQGMVVNLLNPKTALFFFAFLPQFVDPSRGSVTIQILLLSAIFVTMALCSDGMYALLAGTAGKWLKQNAHFLRSQRYVTGGIYIFLGISAALTGNGRGTN